MPFWPFGRSSFSFFDPGLLRDQELELVAPQQRYVDEVLAACRHPQTVELAPEMSRVTRAGLLHFLDIAPLGQHRGDKSRGHVPSYHFWMRVNQPGTDIKMAGAITLRIGNDENLRNYVGHIGYNVYPPARGHHYAERSARLLFPLARKHLINPLWITANPDNPASRITCQRLGGQLVDTVPVPPTHELFAIGEFVKCRYRFDL